MSEQKYCSTCGYSFTNNLKGIHCKAYRKFLNIYKLCEMRSEWIPCTPGEYPKDATFMEAVEWMESGNKAISPYNNEAWFKGDNMKSVHGSLFATKRLIKGAWKLLAPEKSENPKQATVEWEHCLMTLYCFHCGGPYEDL